MSEIEEINLKLFLNNYENNYKKLIFDLLFSFIM
jgi:hypothetical protein